MVITCNELIQSVAAEGNGGHRLKIAVAAAVIEADMPVGKKHGSEIDAAVVQRIDGLPPNLHLSGHRSIEIDAGKLVERRVVDQVAGEERGDHTVIDEVIDICQKWRDGAVVKPDVTLRADRHRRVSPVVERE